MTRTGSGELLTVRLGSGFGCVGFRSGRLGVGIRVRLVVFFCRRCCCCDGFLASSRIWWGWNVFLSFCGFLFFITGCICNIFRQNSKDDTLTLAYDAPLQGCPFSASDFQEKADKFRKECAKQFYGLTQVQSHVTLFPHSPIL